MHQGVGAAWATGQLVFLPLLAAVVERFGWRAASLTVALVCVGLLPVVVAVLRDRPEDVGLLHYGGAAQEAAPVDAPPSARTAVAHAVAVLREVLWTRPFLLLAVCYGLRGIALLAVPVLLGPDVDPPLLVVVALFGSDWVATVPPTVVLCRAAFGPERGGTVFGWVFAAHVVGAAASPLLPRYGRAAA